MCDFPYLAVLLRDGTHETHVGLHVRALAARHGLATTSPLDLDTCPSGLTKPYAIELKRPDRGPHPRLRLATILRA